MPVKIIQLPGYSDYPKDSAALIRQVQLKISLQIPNTDLVSFVDGGEEHNIHPTHKKKMGLRLGRIISGGDYAGTPFVKKLSYTHGELKIEITRCEELNLCGKAVLKLKFKPGTKELEIKNDNLKKNCLYISLKTKDLLQVSYGYQNYPQDIGLYNELGYPLSPFKINI